MDVIEKMVDVKRAAEWFEKRSKNASMPMARKMFELAGEALREKSNGVTVQEWISTDERMPTEDDATDGYVAVVHVCRDGVKTKTISLVDVVIAYPDLYDYWMPLNLPKPPKGE